MMIFAFFLAYLGPGENRSTWLKSLAMPKSMKTVGKYQAHFSVKSPTIYVTEGLWHRGSV